jgi:hypothetical protein
MSTTIQPPAIGNNVVPIGYALYFDGRWVGGNDEYGYSAVYDIPQLLDAKQVVDAILRSDGTIDASTIFPIFMANPINSLNYNVID